MSRRHLGYLLWVVGACLAGCESQTGVGEPLGGDGPRSPSISSDPSPLEDEELEPAPDAMRLNDDPPTASRGPTAADEAGASVQGDENLGSQNTGGHEVGNPDSDVSGEGMSGASDGPSAPIGGSNTADTGEDAEGATGNPGGGGGAPSVNDLDAIAEQGVGNSPIQYRLRFSAEGTEEQSDGTWRTVNEQGDKIHLMEGFVVSYMAALVPCEMWEGQMGSSWPGIFMKLARTGLQLVGIGIAHAGHSGDVDPSTVTTSVVESLTDPGTTEFETVNVHEYTYCKAHYLVGRADDETRLTTGFSTDQIHDISLLVAGSWKPHDQDEWRAFRIQTAYSYGNLKALYPPGQFGVPEAAFQLDTGTSGATVTITRHLGQLFWAVDLREENERVLQLALLRGLVRTSEFEVRAHPLDAPD